MSARRLTRRHGCDSRLGSSRGFTLIEMIVVTLLLLIAMLGLLAVFDASARINKSETDVADAQGNVRYGIYEMTRKIRMAGAGGLYVSQAVLNANDPGTSGIHIAGGANSYNDIPAGSTIDATVGAPVVIREGTDMIEIRGVIQSPLLGFDQSTGCGGTDGCTSGSETVTVEQIAGDTTIGQIVNDDAAQRPQFQSVDTYTASITGSADSMLVIMTDSNADLHVGCSNPLPGGEQRYPQQLYNVGRLSAPTLLTTGSGNTRTFSAGNVSFTDSLAREFNSEMPSNPGTDPVRISVVRRLGVMDDIIYFIAMLPTCSPEGPSCDPNGRHPYLAQGIRRGTQFEITPLAEDVEDLQIAYGVDSDGDNRVSRKSSNPQNPPFDNDPNVSTVLDGDEWQPNVPGEAVFIDADFQSDPTRPFVEGHPGVPPSAHCPRLHGVMLSLLAKGHDSDPTYKGPAATGYVLMDVPLVGGPGTAPKTAVTGGNYRRRVQTLRINLRNYAFQG